MARSSILRRFHSLAFPHCFSLIRAGILEIIDTTDKVHPPYQSNKDAGAVACSMLLVLPSCAIPNLRQAELGPRLPANFDGVTG